MRVSTRSQRDRHTIDNQKILIVQYCKDRGHTIKKWFSDDGVSAAKDRPQFEAMLATLEEADGIVFTKLDRLGRSLNQIWKTVVF